MRSTTLALQLLLGLSGGGGIVLAGSGPGNTSEHCLTRDETASIIDKYTLYLTKYPGNATVLRELHDENVVTASDSLSYVLQKPVRTYDVTSQWLIQLNCLHANDLIDEHLPGSLHTRLHRPRIYRASCPRHEHHLHVAHLRYHHVVLGVLDEAVANERNCHPVCKSGFEEDLQDLSRGERGSTIVEPGKSRM